MNFDSAQPWIYFYVLNSLHFLHASLDPSEISLIVQALKYCKNDKYGGFNGGYMQLPHLGPTYSSFLCILMIGPSAYHLIDREKLTSFFRACKKGNTFQMTPGG
jgi:protein farnesyltransferase subunit beta